MKKASLSGQIQTVLGRIEAESLGVTLPHEHIMVDAKVYFTEPVDAFGKTLAYQPVNMENLSWVHLHHLNSLDNMRLTDEEIAIKELLIYKQAGGSSVVDVSCVGLGRNPASLVRIARDTGLNIIMGTGFYLLVTYPQRLQTMTDIEIADELIRELTEGVEDTGILAGIIGEIGLGYPLQPIEQKVLRACAIAQQKTGAPLSIHPPGSIDAAIEEIIKILKEAGANLKKTVFCHMDIMGFNPDLMRKILNEGCFIEFDTFGHLMVPFALGKFVMDFPSESQRISGVKQIIDEGYVDQVLLSQDTFLKELTTTYGGFGYAHLNRDIIPVMLAKGITEEQVYKMIVENPKKLLGFSGCPLT